MKERMKAVASGAERSATQRSTARTRDTCTTETQCTHMHMCRAQSCRFVSRSTNARTSVVYRMAVLPCAVSAGFSLCCVSGFPCGLWACAASCCPFLGRVAEYCCLPRGTTWTRAWVLSRRTSLAFSNAKPVWSRSSATWRRTSR